MASKKPKKAKLKKWNDCNVIQLETASRKLWHFSVSDKQTNLKSSLSLEQAESIPSKQVEKTWKQLLSPRLNIAWIPSEHIFLRVINLPKAEEEETEELTQMLEFQLEKLSPAPVSQIIWTFDTVPCPDPTQQTVILIIVQRNAINHLLTDLEDSGFYADKLIFPWVNSLANQVENENTITLRTELNEENDQVRVLFTWHDQGWLRNISLLSFPHSDQGAELLKEQLNKTAWTGELEGWVRGPAQVKWIGGEQFPSSWHQVIRDWSGKEPVHLPGIAKDDEALASVDYTTKRLNSANLMPEDVRTKYRQQYIDGMWMSSLGGVLLAYIFGVLIYFVALEWLQSKDIELQNLTRSRATTYTNAMELQAKVQVLQEQLDLKFSALDSLKVISEHMPVGMTLTSFNFSQGKILTLRGEIPTAESSKVADYNEKLVDEENQWPKYFFQSECSRTELEHHQKTSSNHANVHVEFQLRTETFRI